MPLKDELPAVLRAEAENKWEAFQHAAHAAGITPPQNREIITTIQQIFALSEFVAESCTHNPSLLHDLFQSGDLQRRYATTDYESTLTRLCSAVVDEESLCRVLRRCRRREMVRIAWRDLAGWADLPETVADLTAFADACLEQTLVLLHQWYTEKWGVPAASDGSRQKLAIIGLGKLGAQELNFSSDVDLIFAFAQNGETRGTLHPISNNDFFTRLCQQVIRVLSKPTADGFVFRVDLRLRPFGESGPLAMSFDAMEQYYQQQGREWERYALIKARAVAGDVAAGKRLLQKLHPFIYRRYLDYSVFDSLRDMKQMIALDVQRKGMKNDIKLGPGGIREIEFFGQIFQLIRGGVTPALQDPRILHVLKTLTRENFTSAETCRLLTEAYVFLRRTEHRLQEFSDQQTHQLPATRLGKVRLAVSLGMNDITDFEEALETHRQNVHTHFQMLLETNRNAGKGHEIERQLGGIWQDLISRPQALEIISQAGFDQPQDVLQLLDYLRNNLETRELSQTGRNRLDALMPKILKETGASNHPSLTLRRIIDIVKAIERRTSYLALLLENPMVLSHLITLSQASPWITSFLAQHPVLLDELLDPRMLYKPPTSAELKTDLRRRMQDLPPEDLEYQIEQLCIFKQVNVLRVAAADVSGSLPLMRVSDHLSEIAETILKEVVALAWNHLEQRHGRPVCRLGEKRCERGFAVIAYGKLGGLELGYGSDLDLVFLHSGMSGQTRGGERPIDNAQFFNRLGQRVIHILTSHTRAGKVYEIDMRLRPSGSSGILVSHIDAFYDYQMNNAWTWEHQALIKARPICGENIMAERFEHIRATTLARKRPKTTLQQEVVGMREKMRSELLKPGKDVFDLKQGIGGIVDIEFLVQYLVLLHSHHHSELVKWTDNVRLLQTLIESEVIDEVTAHVLRHSYLIYRAAAHQLSLQEKNATVPVHKFLQLQQHVTAIWNAVFKRTG